MLGYKCTDIYYKYLWEDIIRKSVGTIYIILICLYEATLFFVQVPLLNRERVLHLGLFKKEFEL